MGQHGVGPWQIREIIALLDQFDQRGCRVIPVILASAPLELDLPWSLMGIQCVDFRATNSQPLKRLIWAITGAKPTELAHVPDSEKPATMREAIKGHLLPNREDDAATPKWRFGDPQNFKARLYSPLLEPRFAADQFPAVNAFWSLTVYDLPARQLVANSLNRYLINSPMLPSLKSAADGSITLHIQKDTPGKGDEANWLPAPSGSFMLILRTYWLKAAVLDGRWTTPPVQRVN